MPYREPKLQIYQDFEAAVNAGAAPLYSCMIGPNYALHRFSETDEQAFLAEYDTVVEQTYTWPDHVAGAVVDTDNARIMAKDALIRYYESYASGTIDTDNSNQFVSTAVFKTNAYASRTIAAFGDRDVQIGDVARVRWIDNLLQQQELETTVAGFLGDVVSGSTTPVGDLDRVVGTGSTVLTGSEVAVNPSANTPERLTLSTDATLYNGLTDGYPTDTYLIRVVAAGFDDYGPGGNLDGTILNITSAGNDTETTVTLGVDVIYDGSKYPVPLGSRGAVLEITENGVFVPSPTNTGLYAGHAWKCVVAQAYDEIDPNDTAAFGVTGPYTGTKNTKYILSVVLGGTIGTDDVVFTLSTNNGADSLTQFTVPAADFPPSNNDYAVGLRGITLTFYSTATKNQWRTGDVVTFDMLGRQEGAIHTLLLADPITATAGTNLDLDLCVIDTVELSSDFVELGADDIVVQPSATHLSDILGTPAPMSILRADLYADYRELLTTSSGELRLLTSASEIRSVLGPIVQANPLALAAYMSIVASGGQSVYTISVESDDLAGYDRALDILTENDDVHGLVALTTDEEIQTAVKDHVLERSNETNNQWRIVWLANQAAQTQRVYTTHGNGDDVTATVTEFGAGLYRKVTASGALFQTRGVRAGDKLRINFSLAEDGETEIYDTYVVDRVVDEENLILTASLPGPVNVAIQIEIWRVLSNNEYADALAAYSSAFDSNRVYCVWADNPVEADGTALPLMYICAALAGQRSGVAPHAPLSQVTLPGVSLDPQIKFSRTNLNTIGAGGTWIVMKEFSGRVFTRHQLSTCADPDDLDRREQSKTTNIDHISRDFYLNTRDLFGQGNISPAMLALIEQRIEALITTISNRPYPAKIGAQMLGAELLRLEVDATLRDTVVVEINPAMPDPLNTLTIRFKIGSSN